MASAFLAIAARVAVVGLAGGRLEHVADQHHRGLGERTGRWWRMPDRASGNMSDSLMAFQPAIEEAVEHLSFGERLLFNHCDVEK